MEVTDGFEGLSEAVRVVGGEIENWFPHIEAIEAAAMGDIYRIT